MQRSMEKYVSCLMLTLIIIDVSNALTFTRTNTTHAQFPKWNACTESSLSFEFRTKEPDGLLLYMDDSGENDFLELSVVKGRARMRFNIVQGRDGALTLTLGRQLNDGGWHRIEIRRKRMQIYLYVDRYHDSRLAVGSDFYLGNVANNSFVYFGGLPMIYGEGKNKSNLKRLSLPSAFFETRFEGEIRNTIYGNCTCRKQRANMMSGEDVSPFPLEACDVINTCGDCLCVSGDDGPACKCQQEACEDGMFDK
ncbi:neurexin-1-like [Mya arenaria]|uniref:neurexin-1-like n=1 Tax=Mya arenaria TaxID=6604 RepID=UPI0022E32408|nr:neurexin-1-like [Mya arenaria]